MNIGSAALKNGFNFSPKILEYLPDGIENVISSHHLPGCEISCSFRKGRFLKGHLLKFGQFHALSFLYFILLGASSPSRFFLFSSYSE